MKKLYEWVKRTLCPKWLAPLPTHLTMKEDLGLNSKPIRPLDKSALSNDNATLRALTGMLNNPLITGAEVPKGGVEEKYDAPSGKDGATLPIPSSPLNDFPLPAETQPAAIVITTAPVAPVPPIPSKIGLRLCFTGRGLSDICTAIGATEFNISGPVFSLALKFFPGQIQHTDGTYAPGAESFVATLKAWGSGEISAAYPITPARAIFIQMIKSLAGIKNSLPSAVDWNKFGGDEGFWIDSCVNAAKSYAEEFPYARIVVTGLSTKHEFEYVRTQGFTHWHAMARPGVGGNVDALCSFLDNDVTKQISNQRNGARLRCIWKDTVAPTSQRLWSMSDFAAAAAYSRPQPSVAFE